MERFCHDFFVKNFPGTPCASESAAGPPPENRSITGLPRLSEALQHFMNPPPCAMLFFGNLCIFHKYGSVFAPQLFRPAPQKAGVFAICRVFRRSPKYSSVECTKAPARSDGRRRTTPCFAPAIHAAVCPCPVAEALRPCAAYRILFCLHFISVCRTRLLRRPDYRRGFIAAAP